MPNENSRFLLRKYIKLITSILVKDLKATEELLNELDPLSANLIANMAYSEEEVTPMHFVAILGDECTTFVDMLIKYGADVNILDSKGRTPLYNAASLGHEKMLETLLSFGANVGTAVKKRAKSLIRMSQPTNFLLPNLPLGVKIPPVECFGRGPLHEAVRGNYLECVEKLLEAGAPINAKDTNGVTPLLLAGAGIGACTKEAIERYERIIDLFIDGKAYINVSRAITHGTALHNAVIIGSEYATKRLLDAGAMVTAEEGKENVVHLAAQSGRLDILKMLLAYGGEKCVDTPDQIGHLPIHKAAYHGSRECLIHLLHLDGNLSATTNTGSSVLDIVFKWIPQPIEMLNDIFDNCIKCNNFATNEKNFTVRLNFSVLCPRQATHQMAVVSALIKATRKNQQLQLFKHPLLETFIRYKWNNLRRIAGLVVLFQLIFVVLLSTYIVLMVRPQHDDLSALRRCLLATASTMLVLQLTQLKKYPQYYLREQETWFGLGCIVLSFTVLLLGEIYDDNVRNFPPGSIYIIPITILLEWSRFMIFTGKLPFGKNYGQMFTTVFTNVFKVLLSFISLIIGFALAFVVQFPENSDFENPWKAILKTTVMMTGEYDYGSLFQQTDNATDTEMPYNSSQLIFTNQVTFLLFVILGSIVLMNLMVGLAVSDIQTLLNESRIQRLLKQADFIAHIESFTTCFVKEKCPWRCSKPGFLGRSTEVPPQIEIKTNKNKHKLPSRLLDGMTKIALKNRKGKTPLNKSNSKFSTRSISMISQMTSQTTGPDLLELQYAIKSLIIDLQKDINKVKSHLNIENDCDESD